MLQAICKFATSMTQYANSKEVLFCFAFPEFHPLRLYATGISKILITDSSNPFSKEKFNTLFNDNSWLVGWIGYGMKSHFENFKTSTSDFFTPDMCWIEPQVIFLAEDKVESVIKGSIDDAQRIFRNIHQTSPHVQLKLHTHVKFLEYQEMFDRTMRAIRRGDIYEANLCISFDFNSEIVNPYGVWKNTLSRMNAPFSSFVQWGDDFALCFSPERFIQKKAEQISSQPIKGTIASSAEPSENEDLKNQLKNSFKDQTENRMVVDLIRNDLARICIPGTVKVEELAILKSYPGIHHLVSTVAGELMDIGPDQILEATFPMASMTGIPKHSMISLMDEIEGKPRGIYSGSLGYKKPNGDFDLNVVIRTLLYNSDRGMARINAGGAITSQSNVNDEYEECIIKVRRLIQSLDPTFDLTLFSREKIS